MQTTLTRRRVTQGGNKRLALRRLVGSNRLKTARDGRRSNPRGDHCDRRTGIQATGGGNNDTSRRARCELLEDRRRLVFADGDAVTLYC